MTREELIKTIMEVFDDTYGKTILQVQGTTKKRNASDLIRLARKLKAQRRVPSSVFSHMPMKINRSWRAG